MEFFIDHITSSGTVFPVAGYVEMGLAAGSLAKSKGIAVELVHVTFLHPFDVTDGRKMINTHHFGSGMQFVELSP